MSGESVVFQLVIVALAVLLASVYLVRRAARAARARDAACNCGCAMPPKETGR